MTRKDLAKLYEIDYETLRRACLKYKARINEMGNRLFYAGANRRRQRLNRAQINFIVTRVMQDPPEGYINKKGLLIKIDE